MYVRLSLQYDAYETIRAPISRARRQRARHGHVGQFQYGLYLLVCWEFLIWIDLHFCRQRSMIDELAVINIAQLYFRANN